jgi:hypothetical protein
MARNRSYTSLALCSLRTFANFSLLPGKFSLSSNRLRSPRLIIILAATAIFFLLALLSGPEAPLWAQSSSQNSAVKFPKPHPDYGPLGSPECSGQLKMLFRNKKFKIQPVLMEPNAKEPEKIPFVAERLWFCYGLVRDEGDRSNGAILVKVLYQYDSGVKDVHIWNTENIGLYRNESTSYSELDIDSVLSG